MKNWLLKTLSEVIEQGEEELAQSATSGKEVNQKSSEFLDRAQLKAEREWRGAIAALEDLLRESFASLSSSGEENKGVVVSGPAPVFSQEVILSQVYRLIFTPEAFPSFSLMPFCLPEGKEKDEVKKLHPVTEFPLLPVDPIANEQFCLVSTASFALVMVLGEDSQGVTKFQFSFAPEVVQRAWQMLRARLLFSQPQQLEYLEQLFQKYPPTAPDYRLVSRFSRLLLTRLPEATPEAERHVIQPIAKEKIPQPLELLNLSEQKPRPTSHSYSAHLSDGNSRTSSELELVQALTHEVRTPLTTIRTMTKMLLRKRNKLPADVVKRLETIEQECNEQINRMELIFRAAEMETTAIKQEGLQLTTIYLDQVFQQSIPRWQKQAQRRNVNLDFLLPEKLPKVVSNPAMLDQMLTGLMENFTRSLPTGGQIKVQVTTAGNQLKLQFLSQCHYQTDSLKSLGHLLMFQPETGSLSLNLDVTKNLFHALGGKLIVRQRPQQGEVFTVFLPLSSRQNEGDWGLETNKWGMGTCEV